jgi:hypothetical protein
MDHVSLDFAVRDDISRQPSSAAEANAVMLISTTVWCNPSIDD